ncbi:MAG: S8 family serine peptidase, partial [Anaerolineae bacterium]|nr:S8 family serine peptidase [Anaerolineae bacterium]
MSASDKLSQPLRVLLAQLSAQPAARVSIIVRFTKQVDLDRAMSKAKTPSRVDRAIALTDALQDAATVSQRHVAAYLTQPSVASSVGEVHQLWAINGLALSATPEIVYALATYPEVAIIAIDEWQTRIENQEPRTKNQEPSGENQALSTKYQVLLAPTPAPPTNTFPISVGLSAVAYVSPPSKGDVTQALSAIGVDRVWKGLGVTGKGVVVGNIDTGVDWNHPALKTRYRGYDERGIGPANHLHNWFDPTNEGAFYPSDVNGHGTHTMGTMVAGNGIGVAPDAKWIAAKGFNGQGQGLNSWLHRAIQFMLAPGGKAEYAPDILNNSWGNNNPTETEFARDVEVLNAAGIVTFWASGNSGPRSGSISSPASMPGAFAVGATDDENDVANFSGRGPTPDGLMRPHIVAPGVRIASTYPGGNYLLSTGTSQATPHVAGVAALLLSVKSSLDITQTQYVLTSTALPIGEPVPNNDAGWGLVDAYAAVLSQVQTGVITGTVLDNGQPISGALVSAIGDVYQAYDVTDANGNFIIKVRAGSYSLKVNAYGYFEAYSNPRAISANQTVAIEVQMRRMPSGVLRGVVTDARTGEQLPASVRAIGTPRKSIAHHNCFPCRYYLDLPAGEYTIEARLTGYLIQTRTVSIADGVVTDFDFVLNPTQKVVLVDSGAWYLSSFSQYYTESLEALGVAYDVMRIKQMPRDIITTSQLLKYDSIIWSSPSDAPSFTNGDDVISETLALGKNLLLTGQDVAYYDGGGRSSRPYFDKINAWFVDTNDKSIRVEGISQTLLAGRVFTLTGVGGCILYTS